MSGSFLDTTIVIQIAEGIEPAKGRAQALLAGHQPAETPFYALRELLAGHVRVLCETHNALHAAQNHGEAMLALLARSPAEGRKRESRLQAVADAVRQIFEANPSGTREDMKREMLQALAIRASTVWSNARKLRGVRMVQSLECFNEGKIDYGPAGELRGPADSFNCVSVQRCAAAAYMFDNKSDLKKMIAALHPGGLDPRIANKNETGQRRKALKELESRGPASFDKRRCRALGDAYFAAMCPAASIVVTTNMQDYVPLCAALGKQAQEP